MEPQRLSAGGRRLCRHVWSALLLAGPLLILCLLLPATAAALMSTGDGGWSWQDPLPQGNTLEAVNAIDAQHAVAVGDVGSTITTSDGGASWSAHDLGIAGAHVADLSFVDAKDGWAAVWVPESNGGQDKAFLAHTTDGGLTWVTQPFSWLPAAVDFVDARHG
jgi:photosystem II stability/assembly factor-like uncharacterized protein